MKLPDAARSLAAAFNATFRLLRKVRDSVRQRVMTALVVVVCIGAIVGLAVLFGRVYRIESRSLQLGLFADQEHIRIRNVQINIDKGKETDEVTVSLGLSNLLPGQERRVALLLPRELELNERKSGLQGMTRASSHQDQYGKWYPFALNKDESGASCTLVFDGPVLTSSAREVDFQMWLDLGKDDQTNVVVVLSGLSQSDVADVSPPPQQRNMNVIEYESLPLQVRRTEPISLTLRDRKRGIQADYLIIVGGILIGVSSSLLASILWDLIKERERMHRAEN